MKKFEALLEEFRTHTHASSPLGTLDECSLNWKFEVKKKQQQIRQKYPDEEILYEFCEYQMTDKHLGMRGKR